MDILHAPTNHLKIDEMWAFISVDQDGNEGVCAFQSGSMMVPMVAADIERVKDFEPIAKRLAKVSPYPIKLIKFSTREEVQAIKG